MQSERMGPLNVAAMGDIRIIDFAESNIVAPHTIQEVQDRLTELVETLDPPKLILSFNRISYISSAMIGALISIHQGCAKARGELRICDLNSDIHQVLKITKLHKVLNIDKDAKHAVKKLQK